MTRLLFVIIFLCLANASFAVPDALKNYPPEEQAMANDVDPWGMGFADQLRHFRNNYDSFIAKISGPKDFVTGWQTGVEKVFRDKYWFRGSFGAGANLTCARGEHENIQIALIPDTGKQLKGAQVKAAEDLVSSEHNKIPASAITIYRVGYVKTVQPAYPVSHVGYWPDPLLPNAPMDITGADLGLFWVDIHVPEDAKPGNYTSRLTISTADGLSRWFDLRVKVLPFALPKRTMPMVVWTQDSNPWGKMTPEEYESLALMYLDHGIDPVKVWSQLVDPARPESGDALMRRLLNAGELLIDIPRGWAEKPEIMNYIAKKGLLDKTIAYGANDEPLPDTFEKSVIPDTERIRKLKHAPKIYLASDAQKQIDRGVDIWMTDISTGHGLDYAVENKGNAELWTYYCHLPINFGLDRPIPDAPNMLIDNPAIEQRLAYWIAWKYGVSGMFIWAGNQDWNKANTKDWMEKGWILTDQKAGYPYAGIHNGNGFLIYPGPTPSIRMKVLRDGLEDYQYLQLLKANLNKLSGADREEAEELLKVPSDVLVNTHYFSKDPQSLLKTREKIADLIVKAMGKR